jgi:methylenetetrahydrofolate reductase (NADPH)
MPQQPAVESMRIMKIRDLFPHKKRTFSFEFFPPKNEKAAQELLKTVADLKFLYPDFVSVTYGAGGTTRQRTLDLVKRLQESQTFTVMAHFTCVGHTREELRKIIAEMRAQGVENILALRGDPPKGQKTFVPVEGGLSHANELVTLIREVDPDLCIGVAGCPEGHPESPSLDADIQNLKRKVDAGADFIITQLFFDNHHYFDFLERCAKAGIDRRIIPGIMPLTNLKQVKFITEMCGAKLPHGLLSRLEKYEDDPATMAHIGLDHTLRQCQWLLQDGAPGLHFYTLNTSLSSRHIMEMLRF